MCPAILPARWALASSQRPTFGTHSRSGRDFWLRPHLPSFCRRAVRSSSGQSVRTASMPTATACCQFAGKVARHRRHRQGTTVSGHDGPPRSARRRQITEIDPIGVGRRRRVGNSPASLARAAVRALLEARLSRSRTWGSEMVLPMNRSRSKTSWCSARCTTSCSTFSALRSTASTTVRRRRYSATSFRTSSTVGTFCPQTSGQTTCRRRAGGSAPESSRRRCRCRW